MTSFREWTYWEDQRAGYKSAFRRLKSANIHAAKTDVHRCRKFATSVTINRRTFLSASWGLLCVFVRLNINGRHSARADLRLLSKILFVRFYILLHHIILVADKAAAFWRRQLDRPIQLSHVLLFMRIKLQNIPAYKYTTKMQTKTQNSRLTDSTSSSATVNMVRSLWVSRA